MARPVPVPQYYIRPMRQPNVPAAIMRTQICCNHETCIIHGNKCNYCWTIRQTDCDGGFLIGWVWFGVFWCPCQQIVACFFAAAVCVMPTRDPTHSDAVSRNIQLPNIQLRKEFFVLYLVELHRVFCEFEFEEIIEMEVKKCGVVKTSRGYFVDAM